MILPSELALRASSHDYDLQEFRERLPTQDRELLAYRYLFGFNSEEIATALRLSAGGVRSRLKRIRDRARKDLKDD
jgi:RNA polymerase sigma factor (sigma-70 family)